ncbi:hypothetical protein N7455_009122 [Penicillium solitum]|uniref:uncharacterized protein n=1 Tax=Penicillium solitum TaxID=60172 RepID=UPI0017DE7D25|nr:hypothetical protein HAV15_005038 [Penicillium sp. str. \
MILSIEDQHQNLKGGGGDKVDDQLLPFDDSSVSLSSFGAELVNTRLSANSDAQRSYIPTFLMMWQVTGVL